jgi:hypothetical protein
MVSVRIRLPASEGDPITRALSLVKMRLPVETIAYRKPRFGWGLLLIGREFSRIWRHTGLSCFGQWFSLYHSVPGPSGPSFSPVRSSWPRIWLCLANCYSRGRWQLIETLTMQLPPEDSEFQCFPTPPAAGLIRRVATKTTVRALVRRCNSLETPKVCFRDRASSRKTRGRETLVGWCQ